MKKLITFLFVTVVLYLIMAVSVLELNFTKWHIAIKILYAILHLDALICIEMYFHKKIKN